MKKSILLLILLINVFTLKGQLIVTANVPGDTVLSYHLSSNSNPKQLDQKQLVESVTQKYVDDGWNYQSALMVDGEERYLFSKTEAKVYKHVTLIVHARSDKIWSIQAQRLGIKMDEITPKTTCWLWRSYDQSKPDRKAKLIEDIEFAFYSTEM